MNLLEIVGVGATVGAGVIGQIQIPVDGIEAAGKWPVTIALIALAAASVWMAFRAMDKARQSQDRVTDALRDLVAQLAQRPCIRKPEND
jgi:hypothetical protein